MTEIGSQRAASPVLEHPGGTHIRPEFGTQTDDLTHGGYFTQEEIRELVDYASARGITIVPEIEMPGHATAALASYPHLGCVGDGYEVRTTWGMAEDVLCAGKESTFEFIENVLDEVVSLYPGEYIHIGGDECPKVRWKDCPHCQAVIRRERLADEEELQSWFIRRVATMLEKRGKRLIGWDETIQGNLWTEYMDSEAQVEYMAFPRALALAEVLWCGKLGADYTDFFRRMQHHLKRLEVMGVNFCQPRPEDGPAE